MGVGTGVERDAGVGAEPVGEDRVPVGAHVAEVLRSRAHSLRGSAHGTHPCVAVAYERRARELERAADLVDAVLMTGGRSGTAPSHAA